MIKIGVRTGIMHGKFLLQEQVPVDTFQRCLQAIGKAGILRHRVDAGYCGQCSRRKPIADRGWMAHLKFVWGIGIIDQYCVRGKAPEQGRAEQVFFAGGVQDQDIHKARGREAPVKINDAILCANLGKPLALGIKQGRFFYDSILFMVLFQQACEDLFDLQTAIRG